MPKEKLTDHLHLLQSLASIKHPLNTPKWLNTKRNHPCFIQVRFEDALAHPYDCVNPSYIVQVDAGTVISTYFLPPLTDLQIARANVEGYFLVGIWERYEWKEGKREGEKERKRELESLSMMNSKNKFTKLCRT